MDSAPKLESEPAELIRPADLRHELRTPLNQIIGYSEMLLEDASPGTESDLRLELERIHSSDFARNRRSRVS